MTVSFRPVTNTECSDLGSLESEHFGTLAAVVREQQRASRTNTKTVLAVDRVSCDQAACGPQDREHNVLTCL